MKKNYKHCLIDTYCDGGYTYDDYKEWCEINDIEPDGEGSTAFWKWIGEQFENDWGDLNDNIKYSNNNGRCLVGGALGRWDGKHGVIPKIFGSLVEALGNLAKDYDAVQAWETEGGIEFHGLHHDGTDIFFIRPINERRAAGKSDDDICYAKHPYWYTKRYPEYIF